MLQNFVHLKLALPQIILVTRLAEVKLQRTFLSGPAPASFCLFSFFSHTNFIEKTVGIRGIQTRIIGVEGEHADHLTTTTAQALRVVVPVEMSSDLLFSSAKVFFLTRATVANHFNCKNFSANLPRLWRWKYES